MKTLLLIGHRQLVSNFVSRASSCTRLQRYHGRTYNVICYIT